MCILSIGRGIYILSECISGRLFTESHEWVLLSDDKSSASIGISDHAQVTNLFGELKLFL